MAIPPFGAPPTPDASTSKKGKVRLAGDLTGTAALPVLASVITAGSVGSATLIPVITYDVKGRITASTSAAVIAPRAFSYFIA